MSTIEQFRVWWQEALTPPLALQSFTALFGVKPNRHEALAQRLSASEEAPNPAYRSIPGLHNLRWVLLSPTEKDGDSGRSAPRALILSLVFDGEVNDILEELLAWVRDDVLAVLRHCEGFYDESADPVAYVKRRRVPCGYVFRDIGPIAPGLSSARVADATLLELQSALQRLNEFAEFYSHHPPPTGERDAAALAEEFLRTFDVPIPQLPLHHLEVRQPEEERWVRLASELMRRKQRRVARRMNDGVVRRGAHAKAHGLVHAKFKVCEPASARELAYRAGLFARVGEEFDALLRLSNASDELERDARGDVRGLAISVNLSGLDGEWLGRPGRQDFLLIDHPVFIVPNIRRFVEFLAVVEMRDKSRKLWHGLRFLLGSGALKQLGIVLRCFASRPRHPLSPTFHSAVPYQLGRCHIVKYSLEPSKPRTLQPSITRQSDDFLGGVLESGLEQPIVLDFFIHVLPVTGSRELLQRAVEDATLDWSALGAERVKVATIDVGRQSESPEARAQFGEETTFDPWNALAEHRPLGSINRARRVAYAEGASERTRARLANAQPSLRSVATLEPEGTPDREAAQ